MILSLPENWWQGLLRIKKIGEVFSLNLFLPVMELFVLMPFL
jgi:hypothetical protein